MPQNDFTRKKINFDNFTKMPKNVGDLGKFIVAKGFKKLPKVQKNRPIWSHCLLINDYLRWICLTVNLTLRSIWVPLICPCRCCLFQQKCFAAMVPICNETEREKSRKSLQGKRLAFVIQQKVHWNDYPVSSNSSKCFSTYLAFWCIWLDY